MTGRRGRQLAAVVGCFVVVGACTSAEEAEDPAEAGDGAAPGGGAELGEPVEPLSLAFYAADFGPEFEGSSRILAEDFEQLGLTTNLQPIQQSAFVEHDLDGRAA